MMAAQKERDKRERQAARTKAANLLDKAVEGLRKAGSQDDLPYGLLARAKFFRWQRQYDRAWADLNEAKEIAGTGSMYLHLCDYHLEAGRLCLAEGKTEEADHHFSMAKKMIEETGYHRRDKEVERLRREEDIKIVEEG
ncbi:MAG: hypothetical protein GTO45_05820 [Candidatus Aminicenantes bacterium]|nr:hypothetical protein [Candidatus Aminicenantes bacterium]NIM84767.1 hypothetical protein [Candidatus Aminicenantes bacterium]NIN17602.1 hypothetical protein [Candidatus Aminicenantes bacterium]NIN41480.1 hypothetical protein [Candidatus Aminicenantes bacterium]NIN84254.1 hypothetical protein [Candidatus Aminicenantes bacterium]